MNNQAQRIVAVLLSTYNGEQYIEEQLISLLDQRCDDMVVHIRDDGSSDSTIQIIEAYQARYPEVFRVYHGNNLGSSLSFYWLLQNVEADYYFFCDQDDIWRCDKLGLHLARFSDEILPQMVFSDLDILQSDADAPSLTLLSMQKMDPVFLIKSPVRLLCQNPVAGCAMSINRSAKEAVIAIGCPPVGIVHDHWISVIVAIFGQIRFVTENLVYYRLHASNQIGSQVFDLLYVFKKLAKLRSTLIYDLRFLGALPEDQRPSLAMYGRVKLMTNLRRLF